MTQDYFLGSNGHRRRIKRSLSSGNDRDDRGWTMLHVGARRGDLKEVNRPISFFYVIITILDGYSMF